MGMVSVEEALARVLSLCRPLPVEQIRVAEALGRALEHDVLARRTLPPWDNSAMDGYAVRAADCAPGDAVLAVGETIFAGQRPEVAVTPQTCARIMTGARVPEGADAVVMQERTEVPGPGQVRILEAPAAGANIRRRGEDVAQGQPLIRAGTALGLGEAGALWAQGLDEVWVRRRPVVAIATSGDELCPVGEEPGERIMDSNSPVIAQAVRLAGGVPRVLGIAQDTLASATTTFEKGLDADVLVTIAGASVGERDYTRDAFAALGVVMDFWKVAMKPGKPLAVGNRGTTLVVGLPGNPVSALVTFELFVKPALRALQGLPTSAQGVTGRLTQPVKKSKGLRHFVRVSAESRDGALWATPLVSQSSGALTSAVAVTHLASLPPESDGAAAGDAVLLLPLRWS